MAEQISLTPELLAYARGCSQPEDAVLAELRAETALLPGGRALPVPPEQGALLGMLVMLLGASVVLEVGTFTGYSTLCLARALPAGGRVITCELNPRWPAIARPFWDRAGVADRIDVRVGDAHDTLAGIPAGSVDMVFVDADKAGYPRYYERAVILTRPGGLIILDNMLFGGRVADPAEQDADTAAIRSLNEAIRQDSRVVALLLPLADGIMLASRRTDRDA